MSQKFVPPISCAIILIKTFIISTWSFKEMFIALSSTCVQNVSYRYAPFDCLFITFFKDVTAWSEISHVAWRPQMIHSRFFVFTWYAVATSIPNNIFFQVRQLEKKYFGHSFKKKFFPPWGFCTSLHANLTQAERCLADWAELVSAISGAFNHRFSWTRSGLSLLTVVRATSSCFLFCT